MSSTPHDNPAHTEPSSAEAKGYEALTVSTRGLWIACGLLAALLVATGIGMYLLFELLEADQTETAARPADPLVRPLQEPPSEPPLNPEQPREMAAMQRAADRLLSTYGWIDEEQQIVRIPIREAMRVYQERRQDRSRDGEEEAAGNSSLEGEQPAESNPEEPPPEVREESP